MKKFTCALFSLIMLLPFLMQAQTIEKFPAGIQHVIVIGVDGMSPDGIRSAATPVMHSLIDKGAVKWNVRTVLPSSSSPNWASMIMGAGTEAHGITDNDWERDNYSLPSIVTDEDGIFPTIFGWIHRSKPNAEIGAVYQWTGFGRLFEKASVNYDKNMPDETSTAQTFAAYVKDKKPLFAFMHLDHVDGAGHEEGHGTPGYYRAVSKADSLIGVVVKSIKDAGIESSTLLIVTADHGGVGYGHGGATVEEAEIAMMLSGKDIKQGYLVQQQVYTYDLAATIAFALNIVPPYVWTGRPIKAAFTGFTEPANLYVGKTIIPYPKVFPWRKLFQQAGGLYVDSSATVSIQPVAADSKTYYTTDGSVPTTASKPYIQPFKVDSSTVVTARSFDKAGNASLPVSAYYRIVSSKEGHGLKASFYPAHENLNHMPVVNALVPTHEWESYEFYLNRDQVTPWLTKDSAGFAAVFQGYLQIDQPGNYTFYSKSDDGSKLFVDGKEVVNNDGNHGVIEKSGSVNLQPGKHAIRSEYFNAEGGFWLDVYYKGPGVSKQIIPANKLFLKP